MAFRHGKETVVLLDANNISAFTNSTEFSESMDSHDVTAYGNLAHAYFGGLKDGTITIGGTYDDGVTGPNEVIPPLQTQGTTVPFVFQAEGLGTGKPTVTVTVMVSTYATSSPVADMVTWTCELQMAGLPVRTVQV